MSNISRLDEMVRRISFIQSSLNGIICWTLQYCRLRLSWFVECTLLSIRDRGLRLVPLCESPSCGKKKAVTQYDCGRHLPYVDHRKPALSALIYPQVSSQIRFYLLPGTRLLCFSTSTQITLIVVVAVACKVIMLSIHVRWPATRAEVVQLVLVEISSLDVGSSLRH